MSPFIYGLIVSLFGITIVFVVLAGLWGILSMMKLFFGEKKTQEKQDAIKSKLNTIDAELAVANVMSEEMDADEILAVITAAISACMGGQNNLLVRKITRVGDNTPIWGQISRHEQTLNRL